LDNGKKTLMIIGAGSGQLHGINLAKKMGYNVIATDIDSKAPGFKVADESFIASTYDLERTVEVARNFNKNHSIDGVITVGVDVPLTVAAIAKEFNLPGISIESAKLASNKLKMKNKFKLDGISIHWYKKIDSLEQFKNIVDETESVLVLKPIDSRGARGVLRITKDVDLDWAYNYSKNISPTKSVMVEEFISGPQISTESIVWNGKTHTVAYSDRNYEFLEKYSPFIIENGGTMPSQLDAEKIKQISNLVAKAAKSMGIKNGVVKGDVVYSDNGPKIIEIAARPSGGYFCTDQIPLSNGIDIVKTMIKMSLGEEIDINELLPKYNRSVALRFFFFPAGKIKKIEGVEKLSSYKWLKKFELFLKEGDIIKNITNHTERGGVVISIADNYDESVKRAKKAIETLNISIE